jgi:membrane-associated phospholipid phosphatase
MQVYSFHWEAIASLTGSMVKKIIVLLFILLTGQVYSQNLDIRILRAINSPEDLPSDDFFRFISNSDIYFIAGVPAGMAATGLIRDDKSLLRNAGVCVVASIVSSGMTNLLKYTINRDRPFVTYPDIKKKSDAGSPSFPSGHTSGAFATATSLSLSYPKWYIIAPSFAYASLVGYSRMHLGVHYPSDVLAGAAIGAGSAWLTHEINKKLLRKSRVKPCNCPVF